MSYGPVSKIVFRIPPPTEPGAVTIQNIGPFTPIGFDNGSFSVRIPELSPVTPWSHVYDVVYVIAWGNDPYNGVPPADLENIDSDMDPNVTSGTQSLEADDADAGELKTVEVDYKPGSDVYTAYFWVSGDLEDAPIADAGEDQTVASEAPAVTLDATGSSDPDDDVLTYAWTQLSGTSVVLSGDDTDTATFAAPVGPATLVFQLEVDDSKGGTDTDTVTVNVDAP